MSATKDRINTFIQYKDLLSELVSKNLKLKYRRSFLGYIWSVLNPLLIMIIMTVVFSNMFGNDTIKNFPVYLFTGRMIFDFMLNSTNQCMDSILANSSLIKKIYIPKYIFPLSRVISSLIDLIFDMGALLIVMLFTKAQFTLYFLLFPVVLVQVFVFCLGLGLFLAQANVFFRDIKYIHNAITTAWTYLCCIFYSVDALPEWLQKIVKWLNPLYFYIAQFRSIINDGTMFSMKYFALGCLSGILMLLIGLLSFKRSQDKFILYI
jgi:lipopolysaccharide transport system permease protein